MRLKVSKQPEEGEDDVEEKKDNIKDNSKIMAQQIETTTNTRRTLTWSVAGLCEGIFSRSAGTHNVVLAIVEHQIAPELAALDQRSNGGIIKSDCLARRASHVHHGCSK